MTQARLARKLGKSQGYVSLLERGLRHPSPSLTRRLVKVLDLPPTARPLRIRGRFEVDRTARRLAALGYPGFAYLGRSVAPTNPAEVLLETLAAQRVDARVLEAMPFLLLRFTGFDREEIVSFAHLHSLQNRLGFVASLATAVAERNPEYAHRLPELNRLSAALEPLRLAREDALGQPFRSDRFRDWVRRHRSEAAVHWNVLTDLGPEHLAYAHP